MEKKKNSIWFVLRCGGSRINCQGGLRSCPPSVQCGVHGEYRSVQETRTHELRGRDQTSRHGDRLTHPAASQVHSHSHFTSARERAEGTGRGPPAKLTDLRHHLMLPCCVSMEPKVSTRFPRSLLQSKLMEGRLIITMLLLSLELTSSKKYATATA